MTVADWSLLGSKFRSLAASALRSLKFHGINSSRTGVRQAHIEAVRATLQQTTPPPRSSRGGDGRRCCQRRWSRQRSIGCHQLAAVGKGADQVTELGGEWVGPDQARIHAMLAEYHIKTFPTYDTGFSLFANAGQVERFQGTVPTGLSPADEDTVLAGITTYGDMAKQVPLDAPQNATLASDWDSQTLAQWLGDNVSTPLARTLLGSAIAGPMGAAPDQVSLLHTLFVVQSNGGPLPLVSIKGGALQDRIVGGSGLLVKKLTDELGDRVVLRAPVHAISQSKSGARVQSAKGVFNGEHVIVAAAAAPAMAGRIAYDPPMPTIRDQFTQRTPMGWAIKAFAVYPSPFWRQDGLNGIVFTTGGPPVRPGPSGARDQVSARERFAATAALPRMLGRTIGGALGKPCRSTVSNTNPAVSMASSVERVRWQLPARRFQAGSIQRCCRSWRGDPFAATCSMKTKRPSGRSTRRISSSTVA